MSPELRSALAAFDNAMREEGERIDPENCEVDFWYADPSDPYTMWMPGEAGGCVGRVYYTCRPGGMAVVFDDLPEATREKLQHKRMPSLTIDAKGVTWNGATPDDPPFATTMRDEETRH
jgi:hypothetical protein